jgi:hypothetical protein
MSTFRREIAHVYGLFYAKRKNGQKQAQYRA